MSKISVRGEAVVARPIEVQVTYSIEDAIRRFKSVVQKEGILKEYKERMSYEKPSVKKRRKKREAEERRFLQDIRDRQIESGEWQKKKKRKEKKLAEKAAKRTKQQEEFDIYG